MKKKHTIKKQKQFSKYTRKNKTRKRKQQGGAILGQGKDGCIIDSFSCNNLSKENGYVSKFLYNDKQINLELHSLLEHLDPNNERYNRYYLPDFNNCIKNLDFNDDFEKCSKNSKVSTSNMVFQRKLEPFDETKMTKAQYRYLRDSLQILHNNNISHGDLPTNVMMNPINNMPVIIDWEEAKMDADDLDKQIDMNGFFSYYKVAK